MASPRCLILLLMISGSHEWRNYTTESSTAVQTNSSENLLSTSDHQNDALNTSNQSSVSPPLTTSQRNLSTAASWTSTSPQPHFTTSWIQTPTLTQRHLSTPASVMSPSPQTHFPDKEDLPKRVSMSISPSGEIVEGKTVTLTCSSDTNPPVEKYTWFKERKSVREGKTYTISNISFEDSGEYKCKCSNKFGHQASRSVTLNVLCVTGGSVIAYVFAGFGLFSLAALLSAFFWLRYKRQKKQTDDDVYQNAGPSAKDDTYAALDPTGQTSDDVYHTLTTSHPSPDADTSEYYNLETVRNLMKK